MKNPTENILEKNKINTNIENIVIFSHETVKFNFSKQIHDEFNNFEESRILFYNISKNNIVNYGKKLNRIQLNQKEH